MKKQVFILAAILGLFFTACKRDIRIACIGDSITEGAGIDYQSKYSYPVFLDNILGTGYSVMNCGRSGATMLKKSDMPYWNCNEFYDVFAFEPDIFIIILGTNDSKNYNWNASGYEKDYQAMIDTLKTIPAKPEIYLCFPPPAYRKIWAIDDSTITAGILPIILRLAKRNNLPLIDLHQKMNGHPELFPDGIHPNEEGAKFMAEIIAGELNK
jgi:acyl-CoA thioesterase I